MMAPIRSHLIMARCITALVVCLLLIAQASADGIGISLSLDYGTAYIEFENSTSIEAAKVEGSQSYKEVMRSLEIRHPKVNDHAKLPGRLCEDCCATEFRSQQNLPSPLTCSVWEEPLREMLEALRDSVAVHLPQSEKLRVLVVVPFPTSQLFRELLWSIASSLSLKILDQLSAPEMVALTFEPPSCLDIQTQMYPEAMHDGYDLILSIEYTGAALTAMMLAGQCDGFHVERVLHEPSFGADRISRGNASRSRAALKHALQKFTKFPVNCRWDNIQFDYIYRVVMFGDVFNDTPIREVLTEVLNPRLHYWVIGTNAVSSAFFQSPFDVARYAAHNCKRIVHRLDAIASGIIFN